MRLVVADAGPLNYLVLVDAIELLPRFFDKIFIPIEVRNELIVHDAPTNVREWIASDPPWLDVKNVTPNEIDEFVARTLDIGERAALALARNPMRILSL
jgi:predicted nucleic acid-binding protein